MRGHPPADIWQHLEPLLFSQQEWALGAHSGTVPGTLLNTLRAEASPRHTGGSGPKHHCCRGGDTQEVTPPNLGRAELGSRAILRSAEGRHACS